MLKSIATGKQTKLLKTILAAVLGALTVAGVVYASNAADYDVVVRKKSGGFEIAARPIEGLRAPGVFETNHFRVVWKKEEATLTLDRIDRIVEEEKTVHKDDPLWQADRDARTIRLMAANVLYHAEAAHRYFAETLGSDEVKNLEQIIIRLDLTNKYSEYERFANDNYQPQFNNALSIEGGTPLKPRPGVGPWKREIWFRPEKKIPIGEILAQLPEDPTNAQIRAARQQLYPMQIDLGIRNTLYAAFQSRLDDAYVDSITRQAGTFLLMEGAFQVLKVVNRVVIPQKFYLDTAMVPEIIYHEFSHLALSDFMHPDLSTPVNEGMADFFAANVGGRPQLAKKIKAYATSVGKNGKKRQFFQVEHESLGKAQSDYVLGLLWGLRDALGEDEAVNLVYGARKYLTTKDSDIRTGLVGALLQACETACRSPLRDRLAIHQYLQDRGL